MGGIFLSVSTFLAFLKAQRGREKKGPEDKRTPPPQLWRDPGLKIASKMAFVPSPRKNPTFYLYHFFDPRLLWRSSSTIFYPAVHERIVYTV
jgi:hypothetical protein